MQCTGDVPQHWDEQAKTNDIQWARVSKAHQIFSFLAQSLHQGTKPEDGLITALESACSGWWLTSRQAFLQLLQRILSACHVVALVSASLANIVHAQYA